MPASGYLFAQQIVVLMIVATLVIGGVARCFGRPAAPLMIPPAIVFAVACPFLFFWRRAIYGGLPSRGDASLGWPLIYTHAQSDAGLATFHSGPFIFDLALGLLAGAFFIRILSRHAARPGR